MYKLWATLVKDFRILTRDKVGLTMMFVMPIVLVIVITSMQAGAFELINENKFDLLICNKDQGKTSGEFVKGIENSQRFKIIYADKNCSTEDLRLSMKTNDYLVAVVIPEHFSENISKKAKQVAANALDDADGIVKTSTTVEQSVQLVHLPVLQKSYLETINGALSSALQLVENKQILSNIYFGLNGNNISEELEKDILQNRVKIELVSTSKDISRSIPNATQHNVPAWTIFAMFFVVTSLGSNVVKEKLSGSFVRLKTLPTNFFVSLLSKQITYVAVCLLQVVVIFAIGAYLFPLMDLPKLDMPSDTGSLILVSLICAWCAVSYAIMIGVFAKTQDQANGFGAMSIVILSALGGLLVPGFAMPSTFQSIIVLSPLHWCLEAFYDLFLDGGNFRDVLKNLSVIFGMTILIQLIMIYQLKKTKLI